MEATEVSITSPNQELSVPEGNLIKHLDGLFYRLRLVTRQSMIDPFRTKRSETQSKRPLSLRAKRAQLFKEFKQIPKTDEEARKSILAEAHARDEIAKQYLTQGEVKVSIPNLGEQSARYTIITPP